MSFIRIKTIRGHDYAYEVKSVRHGNSVRQKYVKYIGAPKDVTYNKVKGIISRKGDWDNDRVINSKDCRPLDPQQQDIGSSIAEIHPTRTNLGESISVEDVRGEYNVQEQPVPVGMIKEEGIAVVSSPEGEVMPGQTIEEHHNSILKRHHIPLSGDKYDLYLKSAYTGEEDNKIEIRAPADELYGQDTFYNQFRRQLRYYQSIGLPKDTGVYAIGESRSGNKKIGNLSEL